MSIIEAELATPCTAEWAAMEGDDRARHCNKCSKHVYNFAELTRPEIHSLIVKTEGRLCGRFFVRADGFVLTKDCTRDLRLRPSRLTVALGVGAATATVALALAAMTEWMEPRYVTGSFGSVTDVTPYPLETLVYQRAVSIPSEPGDR